MAKEELPKRLRIQFENLKKTHRLKHSFEDFNDLFFLEDFMMEKGYISLHLPRQICSRIVDIYSIWINQLHGLILPNTSNMINMTEHESLAQEEKDLIITLMNKMVAHSRKNTYVGLSKDKAAEAEFLDESVRLWNEEIKDNLVILTRTLSEHWKEIACKTRPKAKDRPHFH